MLKKIIFPLLTVAAIWFFVAGIPIDFYDAHSTLITIVAGILTTTLFAISIFRLLPPLPTDTPTKEDNSGCAIGAGIIAFFFGFSIFLIYRSTHLVANEISENGKYALATVIDGSSFKTRKADFTNIKVTFASEDGKWHTATIDIPASQFNNYGKKQIIPIAYSPKYPTLVKILHSDQDIAKYSGNEVRTIRLSDLEHLFELTDNTETLKYLNSVNQSWSIDSSNETTTYFNTLKNIGVKVSQKEITYIHSGQDFNLFEDELERGNFQKSPGDNKYTMYTNDKYMVIRRNERIPTQANSDLLSNFKFITVISVIKQQ